MLLCFAGIGYFISGKLSRQTERISTDAATKVFQLKSNIIKSEFGNLLRGIEEAKLLVSHTSSIAILSNTEALLAAQLMSHPEISEGWYSTQSAENINHQAFNKAHKVAMSVLKKAWTDSLLRLNRPLETSKLIRIGDSLHWLVASTRKLPDHSQVLLGVDVNLRQLQHYLQSVDPMGRASVFLIDQQGYYLTGPEENLVGTRIRESLNSSSGTTRLADSVSSYELSNSSYLQLPVLRFYTPFSIAGMEWTMVVDTPVLAVDEDVKVIEQYVMVLFILTALIILLIIAWSQKKWQREFMLRQEAQVLAERQQKENALLQLNSLKQKVNPHFLFNSLSSLNGLIAQNPELAKSFVLKLSKVYRYVLESYPNGLASVADEMSFVQEYFFLLKIRFGDALLPLEADIPAYILSQQIPFMSLQTLLENAVKHNILSKAKPLQIKITYQHPFIVLSNNLQLRKDQADSNKQGLNYLRSTYAYFNNEQLKCEIMDDQYVCHLPVLNLTEA